MGCLNSNQNFEHWFGNIHLSGPCNRSCYFCIGQHMMALDPLNNLNEWPLKNINLFVDECVERGITEINLTGSDTDPSLYQHTKKLKEYLLQRIPNLRFGLRTNAALVDSKIWNLFDKISISITSLNPEIYKKTMGQGSVPNIKRIMFDNNLYPPKAKDIKANVVLCPETVTTGDVEQTVLKLAEYGVKRINVREPYGQPHIGDPFIDKLDRVEDVFGMPTYKIGGALVTYWDVHYVEVESVNLYANGNVSVDYPVSRGHDPKTGVVKDQSKFEQSGRIREQWSTVTFKKRSINYA